MVKGCGAQGGEKRAKGRKTLTFFRHTKKDEKKRQKGEKP